jgi:hypothetical protein
MLSMGAPLMPSAYHHKNLVFTVVPNERASGLGTVVCISSMDGLSLHSSAIVSVTNVQFSMPVTYAYKCDVSPLERIAYLEFTVLHNQRSPAECSIMNNGVQEFHGWPLS